MPVRFYCKSNGQEPTDSIDWVSLQSQVNVIQPDSYDGEGSPVFTTKDAAQAALDAQRIAVVQHIVRNGNAPKTASKSSKQVLLRLNDIVLVGEVDEYNGKKAMLDGEELLCPECKNEVYREIGE